MPTTTKPPPEAPRDITHIPPVLSLVHEPPSAASPRIHILGDDFNSKYIAHAMSRMHEHVELLSWNNSKHRSKYVETMARQGSRKQPRVEPNGARTAQASDSNSLIDSLVVTGPARHAVPALNSVKHRLDKSSTICLMSDGLGVLEDVRKTIFSGRRQDEPNFLLGHMSHRIAYNRKHDSIREMRQGKTLLTPAWSERRAAELFDGPSAAEQAFASNMQSVSAFHSSMGGYHEWLRLKMPSIILGAVVEPTCVIFDSTYQELLKNNQAFLVMHTLLLEILAVLDAMPELQGSGVGDFIREPSQRTRILRQLVLNKKNQPSAMLKLLDRGGYTDVNYLNGYFIGRGKKLGLDMPRNTMARDIVKGWHKQKLEKSDRWVDIEETTLDLDQRSRWKPFGKDTHWTVPR